MKVFYDEKLEIVEEGDHYIIYSPINHKWLKVNPPMKDLIQQITLNKGRIHYKELIQYFYDKNQIKLSEEDLKEQIDKLCRTSIFFQSHDKIEDSKINALEHYELRPDHAIEMAYLHPTLRCNFNCTYCYNKKLLQSGGDELNTKQWFSIIDKLKERKVKLYIFTGGEPLLRKDLRQIIEYTKEDNNKVQLLSNGSLLHKHCEELVPFVDKFVISLDSIDEDINAIHRSDYGHASIMDCIKYFSNHHPNKLLIRCVITKENQHEVNQFASNIYEQYGIRVVFTRFIPNNLDEVDLIPELPDLDLEIESMPKINSSIKILRCGASSNIIAIDHKGDIYPCQNLLLPEFKMTNIGEDNWYENIKSSNIHDKFRKLYVKNIDKCGDCSYRFLCGGGCPAIAYKVFGGLDQHLSFLCPTLKDEAIMRLKLADVDWKAIV